MKEDDLPSLNAIIEGFNAIENSLLDDLPYPEVKKLFEDALGIIPKFLAPNSTLGAPIYRVTNGLFPGFDRTQVSFFSHPPAINCKLGRANLAGFPVFYASLSGDTALREFRNSNNEPLQKGDIVYISEWRSKKDAAITYSQFIYDETVTLGEKIIDINTSNHKKLAHISLIYSEKKREAFKLLIEKLGNLYILDKSYITSSFLSHHLLYEDRERSPFIIDALIYPSVQAGFKGINYAIHPEFVKENIKLKSVQKVSFNSFEDGKSSLNFLELGLPKANGKITWYNMQIDLKNVKAQKHILIFDEVPPLEELSDNTLFHSITDNKNYGFNDLIKLGWKLFNENLEESVNQLANFEENINHRKTYLKTLFIKLNKQKIYLQIKGVEYKLEGIAFELKYKLTLREITN